MANARFSKGTKRKNYPPAKFPERVTFRMSKRHMEELETLAELEGVALSVLVRTLVTRFLDNRRSEMQASVRFGVHP